jgi:hypothetical protein
MVFNAIFNNISKKKKTYIYHITKYS